MTRTDKEPTAREIAARFNAWAASQGRLLNREQIKRTPGSLEDLLDVPETLEEATRARSLSKKIEELDGEAKANNMTPLERAKLRATLR